MHFSKIEAATVPSLFDIYHENASLCGKSGKTGPRAAVAQEIRAYAAWLAHKGGLLTLDANEIIGGEKIWRSQFREPVKGVTYGEKRTWNKDTCAYDYEPGSLSVPFPGRNAHRDMVTMETLDDDGNVIASQTLPVEPKKGGVIWDRDTVRKAVGKVAKSSRGKVTAPPSAEIDDRAENMAAETQEAVVVADDTREAVALLSEPEITPAEPSNNPCQLPTPSLADQVTALAAMVEEMRGQLAALSTGTPEVTTPIEEMTTEPPVSGKRERTAAHERMIRRAWTERKARLDAEKHLRIGRTQYLGCTADLEQARKDCAAMTTLYAEAVANLEAARAEIATLKAKPHHLGQEIKPDDYQRLIRERDEARATLASEGEKLRLARTDLERGADMLDKMTERALRAENALRALEQRQARADSPYRVNVGPVSFRAAA